MKELDGVIGVVKNMGWGIFFVWGCCVFFFVFCVLFYVFVLGIVGGMSCKNIIYDVFVLI